MSATGLTVRRSRATVLLSAALLMLAACDADRVAGPPVEPPPGPGPLPPPTEPTEPLDVPVRLTIPTYDGSGEVVHPDVVSFGAPWHGATYWMAVTPYPGGNANYENPSVVVSADGRAWSSPDGLTNPVVSKPSNGYNSDPDLVYDAAGDRLVLVYRTVAGGSNVIQSVSSAEGRHWSPPAVLLSKPDHQAVSPTVTFAGASRPMLWYVDAGAAGCNASVTSVKLRVGSAPSALSPSAPEAGWSQDVTTTLALDGRVVWHVDVIYAAARAEFWAVFHAYERGKTCGSGDLFFARSRDGVAWTAYPQPILTAGGSDWTEASLYRASIAHDVRRGVLRVWFSARSRSGQWRGRRPRGCQAPSGCGSLGRRLRRPRAPLAAGPSGA
jgi:hypothetical protein